MEIVPNMQGKDSFWLEPNWPFWIGTHVRVCLCGKGWGGGGGGD